MKSEVGLVCRLLAEMSSLLSWMSSLFFHGGVSSHGSTIQGGGNVNLTSTTGDIHLVQGNLSADNTLSLDSAEMKFK